MDEYIERKAAVKAACDAVWYGGGAPSVTEAINKIPVADVEPVRHGLWKWDGRSAEWGFPYLCSQCGKAHNYEELYCPNCGAKMKVKDDGRVR